MGRVATGWICSIQKSISWFLGNLHCRTISQILDLLENCYVLIHIHYSFLFCFILLLELSVSFKCLLFPLFGFWFIMLETLFWSLLSWFSSELQKSWWEDLRVGLEWWGHQPFFGRSLNVSTCLSFSHAGQVLSKVSCLWGVPLVASIQGRVLDSHCSSCHLSLHRLIFN